MIRPKFRGVCVTCGATQPRPTTSFTVAKWMRVHEDRCPGAPAAARS